MTETRTVIVTDSSAHIPTRIVKELGIVVIPLWLLWDGESFRDEVDIHSEEYYQRLRSSGTLPTTSQPSSAEFKLLFEKLSRDYDSIIAILVSSKISGTVASALAAVEELPTMDIHVLDTLTCAMGLGLIVEDAARSAKEGRPPSEIVRQAEVMKKKVYTLFSVDTLDFLFKGGRISGSKRLLGTALNIKPILHFKDGLIQQLSQARSKKKAYARILDIIEERLDGNQMTTAAVMDVDAPMEGDHVAELLRQRFRPGRLERAGVSPVVGTHVGPGTIGISFYPVQEG